MPQEKILGSRISCNRLLADKHDKKLVRFLFIGTPNNLFDSFSLVLCRMFGEGWEVFICLGRVTVINSRYVGLLHVVVSRC